jgi:hypothetical protein
MEKAYKTKITNVRKFTNTIETTIQINRFTKDKNISVNQLTDIYNNIKSRFGVDAKIMVRAMNALHMFTFKGFHEEEMSIYDYDEYMKGKVKEDVKFSKFKFAQITILQNIPTVKKELKPEPKIKKFKNKKIK